MSSSSSSSLHWLSLVGTIWLQAINGPNSDFPVYSSQLKDQKDISQVQLNFLAFASDAGKLFGWFSGVAAIYLPLWLVALIGSTFTLVGYGVQYLFLDNSKLEYWHLFSLTSLAGNGICWINTVCYLICIRNFTSDSRVAVGLSTSYLGLSAKVYTVIAEALFSKAKSQAKSYLLLNAIVPMIVTILVTPSLRVLNSTKERTNSAFLFMFGITLATGVCAVVGSIGSKSYGLSSREHVVSLGVLLACPMLVPLGISLTKTMRNIIRDKKENKIHDLRIEDVELAKEVKDEREEEVVQVVVPVSVPEQLESKEEKEYEEVGGMKMLKKVDFWLYFTSYMFSATLGLVFLNNLGQIAESRGLSETSTLVSLCSSFGFFGRLVPSFLDYFSIKRGFSISRTASMAALMAPTAGAFFILLHPSSYMLFISTAIIGACTGAITSFAVSATSELFGTKNFGVNHNIVVANIPIGSFCFGYFAAFLYQRGAKGNSKCIGNGCYADTFLIWGCFCTVGTVLCTVLYIRSRNFGRRSQSQ